MSFPVDFFDAALDFDRFANTAVREHVLLIGATWCIPCKRFRPVFEKVAEEFDIPFNMLYLDDLEDMDEGEAVNHFGVMSVPTVRYYRNGTYTDVTELRPIPFLEKIKELRNEGHSA